MHIHGNAINLNGVNPYNAAADNALAAQRAAKMRRKLAKSAQEIEAALSPEESLPIDKWTDLRHGKAKIQSK
jgi:hypothetical protein